MSPKAMGRLLSLPLIVLALLLSMLGFVPASPAWGVVTNATEEFSIKYNCLEGQTVTFTPGQVRVAIKDEAGNVTGYDQIDAANLEVYPVVQFSSEGKRTQQVAQPGTETTFQPETGLPLNGNKTVWYTVSVAWTDEAGVPEYLPSSVTCVGQATDTDGDGVPDQLDRCPSVSAIGSSDGCPGGAVLEIVSIEGGRSMDSDPGSVTLTVANPADNGDAESYSVEVSGVTAMTPQLADGETSAPMTFEPMPGEQGACATGSVSRKTSCVTFTVPDNTQPAHAGTAAFSTTCKGLGWTVKNTGWETSVFNVRASAPGQASVYYHWKLEPNQSRSGVSPSYYYGLSVTVTVSDEFGADLPNPNIGSKKWVQPAGCNPPMSGGDRLVRWGKVTRKVATPRVTIYTKAYRASYGYQIKGRRVVWFASARPGKHTFRVATLKVPRHKKRIVRYWVEYHSAGTGTVFGKRVFTGWHTYRRP